ncbi:MAG: hypothetical protein AB7N61_18270 [Acidimicrobiia bacterium]
MDRFIEATTTIDLPFEESSAVLGRDVALLFDDGTSHTGPFDDDHQASLSISLGAGATVRQQVTLEVGEARSSRQSLERDVAWRAVGHGRSLPRFNGALEALPDGPRTKLRLVGTYTVPLGVVGKFGDRVLGHRLAVQSLEMLIGDVAARVEAESGRSEPSSLERDRQPLEAEHSEIYIG